VNGAIELALLIVALLVVALLGWDLLRDRLRGRGERARLERLRGEEGEEEELPSRLQPIERRLQAAGLRLGVYTFIAALLILGLTVSVAVDTLFPRAPVAALLAALVAMYITFVGVQEWGRLRARRFERKLVDAVDHMVSALMAGEVPTRALGSAAQASEGAVKNELEEVVHRLGLGMSIRQALERMVLHYDAEGTRLFAQTLAVKWQVGGDLAPVLRKVAWIMRERLRLGIRLRSEMTGVQLAAVIAALIPYLLLPFLLWQRPDWVQTLGAHPLGARLLVGAIVLQLVGLVWVRRVVRIEL